VSAPEKVTGPGGRERHAVGGSARVAFALGSNLGDRVATLRSAVAALAAMPGIDVVAVSSAYQTDPVGGPPGQHDYLNAVVVADTVLPAERLLAVVHEIENAHGRVREERWGPRTLDIDILAVGAQVSADPGLTVPHPLATVRAFVLLPWAEVDPEFAIPGAGTVRSAAGALGEAETAGVRRVAGVDIGAGIGVGRGTPEPPAGAAR
jgi:2-amino-4-hydroxy-6-hydroxymethyldihydropteridine diphosphokinase